MPENTHEIPNNILGVISTNIQKIFGLYYPKDKYNELYFRLESAAKEINSKDTENFIYSLQDENAAAGNFNLLTKHLTIGETYFFREPGVLDLFRNEISVFSHPVNVWSAGCCTGEEAYTLSIIINSTGNTDLLNSRIWATDINHDFLQKAILGRYNKWSFRNTDPGIIEKYFSVFDGRLYEIKPELRKFISFEYLNLASNNLIARCSSEKFDYIFCRNVMMYFDNYLRKKLIDTFYNLLSDTGYLIVSISEVSLITDPRFDKIYLNDSFIFRKNIHPDTEKVLPPLSIHSRIKAPETGTEKVHPAYKKPQSAHSRAESAKMNVPPALSSDSVLDKAENSFKEGRYNDTITFISEIFTSQVKYISLPKDQSDKLYLLITKSCINLYNYEDALKWCTKGIEQNQLFLPHYLAMANIFQLIHANDEAIKTLKTAIYLEPENILANFSLSNLYRKNNEPDLAKKHLQLTLNILEKLDAGYIIEESEGLTAGSMRQIIESFIKNLK
jgi:chemotaxis protein methyltransferase CheR